MISFAKVICIRLTLDSGLVVAMEVQKRLALQAYRNLLRVQRETFSGDAAALASNHDS